MKWMPKTKRQKFCCSYCVRTTHNKSHLTDFVEFCPCVSVCEYLYLAMLMLFIRMDAEHQKKKRKLPNRGQRYSIFS